MQVLHISPSWVSEKNELRSAVLSYMLIVMRCKCFATRKTYTDVHIILGKNMLQGEGSDMTSLPLPKDGSVFGAVVLEHSIHGNKALSSILWSISELDPLTGTSLANTPNTQKYIPKALCSICCHFKDISASYSNLIMIANCEVTGAYQRISW